MTGGWHDDEVTDLARQLGEVIDAPSDPAERRALIDILTERIRAELARTGKRRYRLRLRAEGVFVTEVVAANEDEALQEAVLQVRAGLVAPFVFDVSSHVVTPLAEE